MSQRLSSFDKEGCYPYSTKRALVTLDGVVAQNKKMCLLRSHIHFWPSLHIVQRELYVTKEREDKFFE